MVDKRETILEAALELFVDRGFHGTSVPSVAERAGVGAGTIYRYFASKDALVNELYRYWKRQAASYLMQSFAGECEPRERFHRLCQATIRFALDQPRAFRFLELHHHGSYLDGESVALERDLVSAASKLIASLQASGVLRSGDPHLLLMLLHHALVGIVRAAEEGWIALDEDVLALAEEALWAAIRRPEEES